MAYDVKALFFDGTEAIAGAVVPSKLVWMGETHSVQGNVRIDARVVGADFVGGTSLQLQLQTSDTEAFTVAVVLYETAAIPIANLKVGMPFNLPPIPDGALTYLKIRAIPAGTFTDGHIFAAISEGIVSGSFNPNNPPQGSRY